MFRVQWPCHLLLMLTALARILEAGASPDDNGVSTPVRGVSTTSPRTLSSDCYSNTTTLFEDMNLETGDSSAIKTYTLCPNTVFNIGFSDDSGNCCFSGDSVIYIKSNTTIQCGEDGSSANNCTVRGGESQVISAPQIFQETSVEKAVIKGVIFEKSDSTSVVLGNGGEVSFVDCVFKKHLNAAPILAFYTPPDARRARHLRPYPGTTSGAARLMMKKDAVREWIMGSIVRGQAIHTGSQRILQETNQVTTFESCVFKENTQGAAWNDIKTGVIGLLTPYNPVKLLNCTFANNSYSGVAGDRNGYALESASSDVEIRDSCLVGNSFTGWGAFLVYGEASVIAENNYAPSDTDLFCDFIATFAVSQGGNQDSVRCVFADALSPCTGGLAVGPNQTDPPSPSPESSPLDTSSSAPTFLLALGSVSPTMSPQAPSQGLPDEPSSVPTSSLLLATEPPTFPPSVSAQAQSRLPTSAPVSSLTVPPTIPPTKAPSPTPAPSPSPESSPLDTSTSAPTFLLALGSVSPTMSPQAPSQELSDEPSSVPTSFLPSSYPSLRTTEPPSVSAQAQSLLPTSAPFSSLTVSPTLPCFSNTTILFREMNSPGESELRTYILCPDTVFDISIVCLGTDFCLGGDLPIFIKSNATIQCGKDGSSANNCVVRGGQFQVIHSSESFGEEMVEGAIVKGVTFIKALSASLVLGNAGNVGFVDCIFKDHTNIMRPLISAFYAPPSRRSLLSNRPKARNAWDFTRRDYVDEWMQDSIAQDSRFSGLRSLQASLTQNISFEDCIFQNNQNFAVEFGPFQTGIIGVLTSSNPVTLTNCSFFNNTYEGTTVRPSGFALSSLSAVEVRDTCLIENSFIGFGAIEVFNGASVLAENNFASTDDELFCDFIATSSLPGPNSTDSITCIEADQTTCSNGLLI